jgi:hypothetical protein
MSERTSLMRGQREMATALIACVLLFAGATAAAAQTKIIRPARTSRHRLHRGRPARTTERTRTRIGIGVI